MLSKMVAEMDSSDPDYNNDSESDSDPFESDS
jgi:hypothetical protein